MLFKTPYLEAMREQAPRMYNRLIRTGKMDAHLDEKSGEAHRMLEELTKDAPKLPNGLPENPYLIQAEQLVLETLIEFPPDDEPTAL